MWVSHRQAGPEVSGGLRAEQLPAATTCGQLAARTRRVDAPSLAAADGPIVVGVDQLRLEAGSVETCHRYLARWSFGIDVARDGSIHGCFGRIGAFMATTRRTVA